MFALPQKRDIRQRITSAATLSSEQALRVVRRVAGFLSKRPNMLEVSLFRERNWNARARHDFVFVSGLLNQKSKLAMFNSQPALSTALRQRAKPSN
jgi:hypothetical protein